MKKLLMGVCTFSLLMATSCSDEELVNQVEKQQYTLKVGVGMNSRTYNDEYGKCNWGDSEQIYVFSEDGTVSSVLTLVRKNGKTATFAGTVSGDPKRLKYTVYPVPNGDGEIKIKTIDGNNHNAPMYGTIEGSGAKLNFAGGVVKLDINGAGDGVFTANGEKQGGGAVTGGHYEFDANEKKLKFVSDGNSTVTIKNIPSDGVIFLPVATSADLTAGQKDNVSLTLTTPEGKTITENVQVAQGASTQSDENAFPSVNYDSTYGSLVKTKISNLDELNQALSVGGKYELTNDIETSEVLQIGKNVEIKGNGHTVTSSANRVFRITASKVNVVMNKVKMVSTAVREETNDIRGISIDVDLEGIGLALDTCSVDFTDESAHDWSYAVNVSGNTNHCGITIKGGSYEGANVINVWGTGHGIYIEDATLTSLYQPNEMYHGLCIKFEGNGNKKETYNNKYYGDHAKDFWWPGGDINMTGGGDQNYTKLAVAKVGDDFFYDLNDAVETGQGDIITLFNDTKLNDNLELSIPLYIKGDVTLDLNNKFITQSEGFTTDNEDVNSMIVVYNEEEGEVKTVIKNGEVAGNGKAKRTIYAYGYNGQRNAKLILETENLAITNQRTDGWGTGVLLGYDITMDANAKTKITTVGTYSSVETSSGAVMNVYDGVTIEHSTKNIENSLGAALSAGYVSTINVYGGTVTSDKYAVYALPSGGTVNISNGVFTGLIKDGDAYNEDKPAKVNISGGTFTVDPSSYLINGTEATKITEGQWTVGSATEKQ